MRVYECKVSVCVCVCVCVRERERERGSSVAYIQLICFFPATIQADS